MFKKIWCAIFGHKPKRMLYSDKYISVRECSRCRMPITAFTLEYHLCGVLRDDGVDTQLAADIMRSFE